MKYSAAVVPERGKVVLRSFEKAKLTDSDLIVKVVLAGVCGTDVHLVFDERSNWEEFRIGHEWIGVIDEMGSEAPQYDAFGNKISKGDRIIAYPSTWSDGTCFTCRILLQPNLCLRPPQKRNLPDMGSAYAEYMYIPGDSVIFRIPDSISNEEAILIEPMAGAPAAFIDGIRMARQGGTLVEFGHYTRRGTIPLDPFEICEKDIQIFGSWGYGPQEFGSAIRILEASHSRGINFASLVTHHFKLDEVQKALDVAHSFSCMKAVIEC